MITSRWWTYVEAVTAGISNVEIARKVDIDPSAVSRWRKGYKPDVAFVVKFARAYNVNVIAAITEAEIITDAEAGLRAVKVGVEDLATDDLAAELVRRASN